MSLIPTIYSSTDSGAPVLTGQVGTLAALLDAVLVDGYGSGPSAKAPLGWTREYTATDKRVFRPDPIEGSGYYLRVDDSSAAGNARISRLRAYESMSDIDTGSNPVPTVAQRADGAMWCKSSVASSLARAWWIIGNARCFYLFIDVRGDGHFPFFAGDILSNVPGDQHAFVVTDNPLNTFSGSTAEVMSYLFFIAGGLTATISASPGWIARNRTGAVGAVAFAHNEQDHIPTGTGVLGGMTALTYPDPVSGGLVSNTISMREGQYLLRGRWPGVIVPWHLRPFTDFQVVTDVAGVPGVAELVARTYWTESRNNARNGQVLFETGSDVLW